MKSYYVYIYLDPRRPGKWTFGEIEFHYEPFYVGMGVKMRMYDHMKHTKRAKKNPDRYGRIQQIMAENKRPVVLQVAKSLTHDEAAKMEIDLIETFGRTRYGGILTNVAMGGEGGYLDHSKPKVLLSTVSEKTTNAFLEAIKKLGKEKK